MQKENGDFGVFSALSGNVEFFSFEFNILPELDVWSRVNATELVCECVSS